MSDNNASLVLLNDKNSNFIGVVPKRSNKNKICPAVGGLVIKNDSSKSPSSSITTLLKRIALSPNIHFSVKALSWPITTISATPATTLSSSVAQHIFMKSPHVVAGAELTGTLVIYIDSDLLENESSNIKLTLIGTEAANSNGNRRSFLKLDILDLKTPQQLLPYYTQRLNKATIPFQTTLPLGLGGSYKDKKCSVQYCLESKFTTSNGNCLQSKRFIQVYSNASFRSLKDAAILYTPIIENDKKVWNITDNKHIGMDLSMPRTVWMSGAPIYVSLKIKNATLATTLCDVKLELLRKQTIYSVLNLSEKDQISTLPLYSTCQVVAQSSLASLGWWQPLEPNEKEQITLSVNSPADQFSVCNQKLFDVSFFVRVLVSQSKNKNSYTKVSELSVMLVHPISMDPPPATYTKPSKTINTTEKEERLSLQESVKISKEPSLLSESSCVEPTSASSSSLESTLSSSFNDNSYISIQDAGPRARFKLASPIGSKHYISTMKRSISSWSSRLTRRLSSSTATATHTKKFQISSPIQLSSSTITFTSQRSDNSSSSLSTSTTTRSQEISTILQSSNNNPCTVLKFGQINGPKRFGQHLGSVGDAGLDIRNCFNVATESEAVQSYAAEKVELGDWHFGTTTTATRTGYRLQDEAKSITNNLPPYLEPVCLQEGYEWKQGLLAPLEKCEIDASLLASGRKKEKNRKSKSKKRMLASSRHLINLQRNSVN